MQRALFAQSCAADALSSAAVFIWDAVVKVISRSSTLVIGISSEPCCPHFVALLSAGSTKHSSGDQTDTAICLWIQKDTECNGASNWCPSVSVSFILSAPHCHMPHVNHVILPWSWVCVSASVDQLNPRVRVSSVQFKTNLVIRMWAYGESASSEEWDSTSVMRVFLCFRVWLVILIWNTCKAKQIKVTKRKEGKKGEEVGLVYPRGWLCCVEINPAPD